MWMFEAEGCRSARSAVPPLDQLVVAVDPAVTIDGRRGLERIHRGRPFLPAGADVRRPPPLRSVGTCRLDSGWSSDARRPRGGSAVNSVLTRDGSSSWPPLFVPVVQGEPAAEGRATLTRTDSAHMRYWPSSPDSRRGRSPSSPRTWTIRSVWSRTRSSSRRSERGRRPHPAAPVCVTSSGAVSPPSLEVCAVPVLRDHRALRRRGVPHQ
jgi:hypothetical protein